MPGSEYDHDKLNRIIYSLKTKLYAYIDQEFNCAIKIAIQLDDALVEVI